MSEYTIDWTAANLDGDTTLSGVDGDVGVTISTPTNPDGDTWALGTIAGETELKSSSVDDPTTVSVEFDQEVENVTFELFDVDSDECTWDDKITIYAYAEDGSRVEVLYSDLYIHDVNGSTIEGEGNSNPGVEGSGADDTVTVTIAGPIVRLEIIHDDGDAADTSGTVGIGELSFDAVGFQGDGTVEGTDGDDVIDLVYTGDPEGDMVDNNDAILPGHVENDDLIYGFEGDDTIEAGAGDDTVYGGTGSDSINGDIGNDVIYGDTGGAVPPAGPVREVFEWNEAPGFADEADASTFTQNTGSVDVTFTIDGVYLTPEVEFETASGFTDDIDTGGLGPVDVTSNLAIETDEHRECARIALDFADPVENVEFRVNDADYDSEVIIKAYDADGNQIPVTLTAGDNLVLTDEDGVAGAETANSTGGGASPASEDYSLLVEIDGPVSRIEITHNNDGGDSSHAQITDVYFDVPGAAELLDDTIEGGEGDDIIFGEGGNDTITDSAGNDSVEGGDGDDFIDVGSNSGALPDIAYPGIYLADPTPHDDHDTVSGGAGNDTIYTGDDADVIDGGTGDDFIDGGIDADTIDGGDGHDTIIGGEGGDTIDGGDGDDLIYGGLTTDALDQPDVAFGAVVDLVTDNNKDTIHGGEGNDTIYGRDDDDVLYGDAGDDYIDGGVDEDTIIGGEGADTLFGGSESDLFLGGNGGDVVTGGEDADGDDFDVLDLTGSDVNHIDYTPGDPEAGTVHFNDGSTMTFSEIERVIPCFTPGTTIATPKGERLVEELQEGDRIITRDNGIQEIAWVGHKVMSGKALVQNAHLKPILVKAGALGGGLPERDMLVSPNHRLLVASDLTQLYFEEREVLAAAKHLVGSAGIHAVDVMQTTYVHFMFERHEVVLSNGTWTESFQPGDYSLKGIGNSQRAEIFELFPELRSRQGLEGYQSARKSLKKHEARLLVK